MAVEGYCDTTSRREAKEKGVKDSLRTQNAAREGEGEWRRDRGRQTEEKMKGKEDGTRGAEETMGMVVVALVVIVVDCGVHLADVTAEEKWRKRKVT